MAYVFIICKSFYWKKTQIKKTLILQYLKSWSGSFLNKKNLFNASPVFTFTQTQ